MKIILQSAAMVCLMDHCRVIWEGPQRNCPQCGREGVPYRDIEELANGAPLPDTGIKMLTNLIQ